MYGFTFGPCLTFLVLVALAALGWRYSEPMADWWHHSPDPDFGDLRDRWTQERATRKRMNVERYHSWYGAPPEKRKGSPTA